MKPGAPTYQSPDTARGWQALAGQIGAMSPEEVVHHHMQLHAQHGARPDMQVLQAEQGLSAALKAHDFPHRHDDDLARMAGTGNPTAGPLSTREIGAHLHQQLKVHSSAVSLVQDQGDPKFSYLHVTGPLVAHEDQILRAVNRRLPPSVNLKKAPQKGGRGFVHVTPLYDLGLHRPEAGLAAPAVSTWEHLNAGRTSRSTPSQTLPPATDMPTAGGESGMPDPALATLKARALSRTLKFRDLDVSIETDKGEEREWHDPFTGRAGVTKMKYPYGYIRKTMGVDGDHVDVFVGPEEDAPDVHVVHQKKAPLFIEYDEDKCMLGWHSADAAKEAYLAHYDDPRFFGRMTSIPFDQFKDLVFGSCKGKEIDSTTRAIIEKAAVSGFDCTVVKSAGGQEERFVKGVVLEPDVVDLTRVKRAPGGGWTDATGDPAQGAGDQQTWGDTYSAEEIRKACYWWMENSRFGSEKHMEHGGRPLDTSDVALLENYITDAPCVIGGRAIKAGTWVQSYRVRSAALWQKVKKGELKAWSMGARTRGALEEVEIDG